MPQPLAIIGLDPGTTSAYAVLDLHGSFLQAYSARELPLSQIIARLISFSQPLVAATDKGIVPSFVQEFSAKLGTILLSPPRDLSRQEKRDLLLPYPGKARNSHEEDALASALFAYKRFHPTLLKIDNFIKKNNLESLRNPFTQLILKENLNFDLAKKLLVQPQKEESRIVRQVFAQNKITKTNFLKLFEKLNQAQLEKQLLEDKLHQLRRSFSHLQQTNLFLAKKFRQTDQQINNLLSFKEKRIRDFSQELNKKEKEKEFFQNEIKELNALLFDLKDKIVIRKVKDLGRNFKKKDFEVKENDCLFVEDPCIVSLPVLEELAGKGVKLFSPVEKKGFFLLKEFTNKEGFIITAKDSLNQALSRRNLLDEILEEHQNFRLCGKSPGTQTSRTSLS